MCSLFLGLVGGVERGLRKVACLQTFLECLLAGIFLCLELGELLLGPFVGPLGLLQLGHGRLLRCLFAPLPCRCHKVVVNLAFVFGQVILQGFPGGRLTGKPRTKRTRLFVGELVVEACCLFQLFDRNPLAVRCVLRKFEDGGVGRVGRHDGLHDFLAVVRNLHDFVLVLCFLVVTDYSSHD